MEKKTFITAAFISVFLLSAVAGTQFVNLGTANPVLPVYLPIITIGGDGSVTPKTEYINRTGNIYTLTADIIDEYSIDILCSNIIFDGAEHTINISENGNSGLRLRSVTNVTVKNLEVISLNGAMILISCSNCIFIGIKSGDTFVHLGNGYSNTITESNAKISLLKSKNNLILKNNISGLSVILSFNNNFSQNNILCYVPIPRNSTDHWDNGSVGNYWKDYLKKNPNASEISGSGIGDTPYVIDADNVDNYPLMYPYDIEKDTIAFPTTEPTSTPEPEPFPTALVATASGASVAIIGAGLLVYFKKRNK